MATIGAFISPGRSLPTAIERVRLAESLGYRSAFVTHVAGRDSLSVLAAYAAETERIELGTGVLPIYSRTPVATAQAAATVDEISGGRMVLGLGVSHRTTIGAWYGTEVVDPVEEMREYVSAIRAMLAGGEPPAGERWPTSFRFRGYEARPELPIYVAALSPDMLRLAGEIADGVMLWLCDPRYIRDVVVPTVAAGRRHAGKRPEGFEIVAAVPCAIAPDRATTLARVRSDLVGYLSLPSFRAMLERSGYGAEIAGFDAGIAADDRAAAEESISEPMLEAIGGFGDAGDVRGAVRRYLDAGVTSPAVAPVPTAGFEATLEAGAAALGEGGSTR